MPANTECLPVQPVPSFLEQRPGLALVLAICVSAMCLWMASIMLDMSYNMGQMTDYVESMSNNVDHMSKDVFVMKDQFVKMNGSVASMEFTLKELNSHMIDMDATVSDVDKHMNQMQSNLKDIQAGMQKDMDSMRVDIGDLKGIIRFMSDNITSITFKMGRMTYDINRSSRSFSSPADYMQNMMSPP